tara:strand:- start:965 stop:2080 length:1116 start_codon:yes stop_codon:yes gene_type:complete
MAIAGTNITLNATEGEDKITVTEKVTTPYFSNGSTELLAANIVSESLSDTNEKYFFGIAHSSTPTTTEFHVAYGNSEGNGGDDNSNAIKSPTQAIYKQFSNLLLPATEVTGGFFISRNNSLASAPSNAAIASGKDQDIFVVVAERARMKDRLNKKNWTIILSGSNTHGDDGNFIHLTDDSANDTPVSTPAGDRFNIVSGSDGTITEAATSTTYGFYYPDQGIMVFSGAELSASLPGSGSTFNNVVTFDNDAHKGFVTTANQDNNYKTALRFINCLKGTGAKLKFRDEEDQISTQYFCRAKAGHFNFSNNPTFVSGSQNELRHSSMKGNPTTFITSVQLYNSSGDMVAVGNLSTPLKKNFSTEATIKVKLTY